MDRVTGQRFLVDTGADVSILPAQHSDRKATPVSFLQAVNGTRIPVFSSRSVMLNLGLRRALHWIFLVADVRRAVIGADFLHNHGFLVDVQRRRLIDSVTQLSVPGVPSSGTSPITPISAMLDEPFAALLYASFPLCRACRTGHNRCNMTCAITLSPPAHQSFSDPGVCPRRN